MSLTQPPMTASKSSTTTPRLQPVGFPRIAARPAEHGSGTQPSRVARATEPSDGTRPTFTITDAATACSVSRKTITRKLPDLSDHGAAKDDDGVWRIPVEALLAVGLHPGRSVPESPRPRPAPHSQRRHPSSRRDTVTIPRDRWDDLRIRLARAEAEANERAAALADARLALRALTAGPGHGSRPRTLPAGARPRESRAPAPERGTGPTGAGRPHPRPRDHARRSGADQRGSGARRRTVLRRHPSSAPEADRRTRSVAARNLAARTGGYVPAAPAPAKKRRWWHSA